MKTMVLQRSHLYLLTTIFCLLTAVPDLRAQGNNFEARVSKVVGDVRRMSGAGQAVFAVKRNDQLSPGDTIETGKTGQVVIWLTDGSQITILPRSQVRLKDFSTASSARELLEITLGHIRVKIYHLGGRPNPYRLNSPTASIAVRGTEFLVDVQQNGETLVKVFEGLVEVSSYANPNNRRLVTPGRRVIVRPGGDISMAFPGPGSGLNGNPRLSGDVSAAYQDTVSTFVQGSAVPSPSIFTAFLDRHLDSLENPAYATDFTQAQGRLSTLPSISHANHQEMNQGYERPPEDGFRPFDYTVASQLTFFMPIPGSRYTVGGSTSAVRTNLHSMFRYDYSEPGYNYSYRDYDDTNIDATNIALIAARRMGKEERTSIGIELEHLSGGGDYRGDLSNVSNEYRQHVVNTSNVDLSRTRLTLGFAHDFSGGRKLGIYYRYGITSSDQQNFNSSQNGTLFAGALALPYSYDGITTSIRSSEVGARWHGLITRRLFYGIEGSYLSERIGSRYSIEPAMRDLYRDLAPDGFIRGRDHAHRARLGAGLGFALRPKTVIGFDVAGGAYRTVDTLSPYPFAYGQFGYNQLSIGRVSGHFISTHAGMQTSVWRGAFVSASFLVTQRKDNSFLYNTLLSSSYRAPRELFSRVGAGWKFNQKLLVQYLFCKDNGFNSTPSHSLVFRYTFNLTPRSED